MHVTQIIIWLIIWKWQNFILYSPECYSIFASIFASRPITPTSNNHFFALPTIQLGHQSFDIRFDKESWSGSLLRRNFHLMPPKNSEVRTNLNYYFLLALASNFRQFSCMSIWQWDSTRWTVSKFWTVLWCSSIKIFSLKFFFFSGFNFGNYTLSVMFPMCQCRRIRK